jgi:hypothetical protein
MAGELWNYAQVKGGVVSNIIVIKNDDELSANLSLFGPGGDGGAGCDYLIKVSDRDPAVFMGDLYDSGTDTFSHPS